MDPTSGSSARCRELDRARTSATASASSGCPSTSTAARRLRADLPPDTYLWVNAAEGRVYSDAEAAEWTGVDPLFGHSRHPHPSRGLPCRTGRAASISVDGDGTVRRCHFVPDVARQPLRRLVPRRAAPAPLPARRRATATSATSTSNPSASYDVFAGGVLERIPAGRALPLSPV